MLVSKVALVLSLALLFILLLASHNNHVVIDPNPRLYHRCRPVLQCDRRTGDAPQGIRIDFQDSRSNVSIHYAHPPMRLPEPENRFFISE